MTPSLLLRIGSIASLLFAAGHTLGGTQSWSPRVIPRSFRR